MDTPVFSIIMPVWNRETVVSRAVESVLQQEFDDYKLLVIDDGSEDRLEDRIRPYLSARVSYHKTAHGGAGAARNRGLRLAKGKYIAYLDSDNRWHPDFLVRMHDTLENHKARAKAAAKAAYCRCRVFKTHPDTGDLYFGSIIGRRFDYNRLLRKNFIDLNAFVHAKECIDLAGYFDETLHRLIDWDFILRVTSQYEPRFVSRSLVDYYYCTEKNAISCTEESRTAYNIIRERYMSTEGKTVRLNHDTIDYKWEHVPEKKHQNRLAMRWPDKFNVKEYTSPGFPHTLQIEPTNRCNLSCTVCPAAADKNILKRKRRDMTLPEFTGIIDDMSDYLLFLVLWDWGEPFMNPSLPEMIAYAADKGIKTVTSTNGHFLQDTDYVTRILQSGLETLIVAIESLDEAHYLSFRTGGSLPLVLRGVENTVRLRNRLNSNTTINWRTVVTRHNEHELGKIERMARAAGADRFTVKTVNPTCGEDSVGDDSGIAPENPGYRRYAYKPGTFERVRVNAPCRTIWHMSNINANGDVVPCTYDYDAEMKIGNVFETPFTEIWKGPAYRDLRKKIYHEKESLHKCKNCDINFKLSRNGWFVTSRDFNAGIRERTVCAARQAAKRMLENRIRC